MSQLDQTTLSFFTEKGPDLCAFFARQKFPASLLGSTAHFLYAAGHQIYDMVEYERVAKGVAVKNQLVLLNAREAGIALSLAGRLFAEYYATGRARSCEVERCLPALPACLKDASRFLYDSATCLSGEVAKRQETETHGGKVISLATKQVQWGIPAPLITKNQEIERAFARAVSLQNLPAYLPDCFSTDIAKGTGFEATVRQLTLASIMRQTLARALDHTARRFVEPSETSPAQPSGRKDTNKPNARKIILLSKHRQP